MYNILYYKKQKVLKTNKILTLLLIQSLFFSLRQSLLDVEVSFEPVPLKVVFYGFCQDLYKNKYKKNKSLLFSSSDLVLWFKSVLP